MPPKKLLIRGPVETVATTSPVEPLLPDPADVLVELQQAPEIRRTTVVLVMPPKFPVERFLLLFHRIMPILATPFRHSFQTAPYALPHRAHMNRELPLPASRTDMRESKKIERGRLRPSRFLGLGQGLSPKLHQPSLVRMQR